jgi:diguanylate cyclase
MTVATPHTNSEHIEDQTARLGVNQFARLQRAVVKLVFSFRGQNTELDERLRRLGLTLKSTPKSTAALSLIDEVVDHLIAAELGRSAASSSPHQIVELLRQLQFETEAAAEARSLHRRLIEATTNDELNRLSRETALLINRQLKLREAPAEQPSANSEEPLGRLLKSLKLEGDLRGAIDHLHTRVAQARSRSAWLEAAEEAAASLSFALANRTARVPVEDLETARQPLLQVLEAVATSDAKNRDFEAVRSRLTIAANPLELMMAASSFGEALKSERKGFDAELQKLGEFLKNIARRVEEFRANLQRSGHAHEDSVKNAALIQTTLQTHVDQIKGRITEEKQLDHLKIFVTEELVKLEDTLSEHLKADSGQHQDASQDVTETLRRLSELEAEMAQLRTDFDEQQSLNLIDPLTGVFNRLGYIEGMNREYARWQREGGSLSLAIFDLDLFKNINDQFGHATGDKVLSAVAATLRKHVRGVDLICRFGGEEFVLIMPETSLEGAATVADKLRSIVGASKFRFKDAPVPVTVSCGVATFRAIDTVDEAFERADRALYQAKRLGRDCCCVEAD